MDPFVTLSAAAAVTKTLKLGTAICLVIQRDTIQTSKAVASLDQISKGRFLFGIGCGWNAEEMEDHGTVYETRALKMREHIKAMKEIWSKDKPEYHGEIVASSYDDLAQAGTEAASSGCRGRRLSPRRAPRSSLWRRNPAVRRQHGSGQSRRIHAGMAPHGRGSRPRPAITVGDRWGPPRGSGCAETQP
jgi:alkanesulfonate monooxygenase SsuD/methylene tetrahydromethanopterin reductase-like flavin-dependent oxidoreductase (luciferase family)